MDKENLMYELAEYALVVVIAAMVGGISFVSVATFLSVMERFNSGRRSFRAR
jgi:hypothetical protein